MPRWMTGVAMTVSWMVLALARQVRPELASVGVAVTEATWRKLLHKVRFGPARVPSVRVGAVVLCPVSLHEWVPPGLHLTVHEWVALRMCTCGHHGCIDRVTQAVTIQRVMV